MKQTIRSIATHALSLGKAFPVALTDRNAVQALMEKLYPITTDKGLIRMGPQGDGGYLVPDDLEGIAACFSPGVCFVSGFEKDCAHLGINVFMADKSVDSPPDSHDLFHFSKKYIGVTTNDDFMTIDDWVASSVPDSDEDLLLQIDIEGFEYEVFLNMSDSLMKRNRIIVAEFHNMDQLWNKYFFNFSSRAFEKILQTHSCVHIHPNNHCQVIEIQGLSIPTVAEFTFLRKDRIHESSYARSFPHPLDCDNSDDAHLPLPKCWYHE